GRGIPAAEGHGRRARPGNAHVRGDSRSGLHLHLEAWSIDMGLSPLPVAAPVTHESISPNWITTRLDFLANWGRSNSLWPMPFGTACCAIEFMATAASRFDIAR